VKIALALALVIGGCGGPPAPITPPVPENVLDPSSAPAPIGSSSASAPAVDRACIVAGNYSVAVDLKSSTITQGDTGQGDTEWCTSMLAGVASQAMSAMAIRFDGGALAIEWPPGHPATFDVLGPCEIAITSQPMRSHLTFAAGSASGTTTYTVGTQHQGDTCTATNAALSVTRAP
jgi:hypothetical protein